MPKTDLVSLREGAHKTLSLPKKAQQVVDAYLHLHIGGVEAACPYHINPGLRSTNRALLGKGSPADIQAVAVKYFDKYDMQPSSPEQLRDFLTCCGIGVDCSGFTSWVLNEITLEKLSLPIWKSLRFPGLRRTVVSKIRPVQNISANLLTGSVNSVKITDLNQLRPSDLLRIAGWHHVMIVTDVGFNAAGVITYFEYAQSSCSYGAQSGVSTGYVIVKKPDAPLSSQQWFDVSTTNSIQKLITDTSQDSYAVRLKTLR